MLGVRRWRGLVIDREKWRDIVRQAVAPMEEEVCKTFGAYFEMATIHYFAYAWLTNSAEIGFFSIRRHVN
jgi:hypothetical protein